MQISNSAYTGVETLVRLAVHNTDRPCTTQALARSINRSLSYTEALMARLRSAGLVVSRRGCCGSKRRRPHGATRRLPPDECSSVGACRHPLRRGAGAEGFGDKGTRFAAQAAGPFKVGAVAIAGFLEADLPAIRPGADTNAFPEIAAGRFRDARFIRVGLSDAAGDEIDSEVVEGAEGIAHGHVHLPETLDGARLWVEIEGWNGRKHRAFWPLLGA